MSDTLSLTPEAGQSGSLDIEALEGHEIAVRPFRDLLADLRRNPLGLAGLVVILITVIVAAIGPEVWRISYANQDATRLLAPSWAHPMGTDELGRDVFSRVIHGARVSLEVGVISIGIALVFGTALGVASAYYGRFVDAVLMRIVDILFAVPALILAIVIAGLLGPSRTNSTIAIGIVYLPVFARVARGSSLSILSLPYVEAARALGVPDLTIMRRHILRNIFAPLVVLISVYLSAAILTEASLSFLGLGTQPPEPSWGSMLQDARAYMQEAPWLAVFPGLAIMLVVLGFNFLGDGLRDTLDPRLRDR